MLGGTLIRRKSGKTQDPVSIDSVELDSEHRLLTGITEFDRVLGGGLVTGSLVLIGGDPGIGKSTLMLQALYGMASRGHKVLYVSGEESVKQIKIRSERLSAVSPGLLVVSEIALDAIMTMVDQVKPDVLVIDSIQTMYNGDLSSAPGSVSQVRESHRHADFIGVDDLMGDQHILNPRMDKSNGVFQFGAGNANGPGFYLVMCEIRQLVSFGVRPQLAVTVPKTFG